MKKEPPRSEEKEFGKEISADRTDVARPASGCAVRKAKGDISTRRLTCKLRCLRDVPQVFRREIARVRDGAEPATATAPLPGLVQLVDRHIYSVASAGRGAGAAVRADDRGDGGQGVAGGG